MSRKPQRRSFKRFQIGSMLAIAVAGVTALAPRAMATTKANNNNVLNLGTSWIGGVTPQANGDVALFDSTFATGNPALSLGGNVSWAGIQLISPVQAVNINPGNILTLGGSGIDTDFIHLPSYPQPEHESRRIAELERGRGRSKRKRKRRPRWFNAHDYAERCIRIGVHHGRTERQVRSHFGYGVDHPCRQ